MEVSYKQAMETLQSMFDKFDKETIQAVLASNEGHLERTIEDLMKLNEEIENSPDDDNLFADTDSKPSYPGSYGGGYQSNSGARNAQESEDAKLAYQLQMQEIRQEQQEKDAALGQYHGQSHSQSHAQPVNQYGGNVPMGNQYSNQYGHQQGMAESDRKKATFYKKLKVGLNNLFKRKGKAGSRGPTRNPGIYAEIDGNDGNGNAQLNQMEDDDNDAPMQLADVLGGPAHNNDDSVESPSSPYNNRRHDEREYSRNRPSQFGQMNYTGEL